MNPEKLNKWRNSLKQNHSPGNLRRILLEIVEEMIAEKKLDLGPVFTTFDVSTFDKQGEHVFTTSRRFPGPSPCGHDQSKLRVEPSGGIWCVECGTYISLRDQFFRKPNTIHPHPFVSTPNNGPCSSCGHRRSDPIHQPPKGERW